MHDIMRRFYLLFLSVVVRFVKREVNINMKDHGI